MAKSFTAQITDAVQQLQKLDRDVPKAMKAAAEKWADNINDAALAQYGRKSAGRSGKLYRIEMHGGDEVRVGWYLRFIPWFLEKGTKPHLITPRAVRRSRLASDGGGAQRSRRVSQKQLDREVERFGGRRSRFALNTPKGPRAHAKHPGIRPRWVVRKLVTANADDYGRMVQAAIADYWRRNR